MKHKIVYMIVLLVLMACHSSDYTEHRGKKMQTMRVTNLDSLWISGDSLTGEGNFFILDSCLYLADRRVGTICGFSLEDGHLVSKELRKGNGRNELPSFMYFYPFRNKPNLWWAVDGSYVFYTYDRVKKELKNHGRMNFGWNERGNVDFDSPSWYGLMEMSDFGVSFTYLNDSSYLIPVNVMHRYIGNHASDQFRKGHIFGKLNSRTMSVERVFGRIPDIYHNRPTTFFDFFHYDMKGDTVYVSHAIDSLIYVYKYPETLLYTMGYEGTGVKREYTETYELMANYRSDVETVGMNTSMSYVPETGLLLRTMLTNGFTYEEGKTILQVYKDEDLVLETSMPDYFQYLGYYNGKYYGIRHISLDMEDGQMFFVLYSFRITRK